MKLVSFLEELLVYWFPIAGHSSFVQPLYWLLFLPCLSLSFSLVSLSVAQMEQKSEAALLSNNSSPSPGPKHLQRSIDTQTAH